MTRQAEDSIHNAMYEFVSSQCHNKGDDRGLAWNAADDYEAQGRELGRQAYEIEDGDARTEWLTGCVDAYPCGREAGAILWAAAEAELSDLEDREPSAFFQAAALVVSEFGGWS